MDEQALDDLQAGLVESLAAGASSTESNGRKTDFVGVNQRLALAAMLARRKKRVGRQPVCTIAPVPDWRRPF